jgi:hypothetical protein
MSIHANVFMKDTAGNTYGYFTIGPDKFPMRQQSGSNMGCWFYSAKITETKVLEINFVLTKSLDQLKDCIDMKETVGTLEFGLPGDEKKKSMLMYIRKSDSGNVYFSSWPGFKTRPVNWL